MARTNYQNGSVVVRRRFGQDWYAGKFHEWILKDGKKVRKYHDPWLGPVSEISERQAWKLLQPMVDAVNRRTKPVSVEVFAGFVARWMQDTLPTAYELSTQAMYRSEIKHGLIPFFGEMPLAAIDGGAVQRFVRESMESGKQSKRIKNWVGILQTIWRSAVAHGRVEHDPFRWVKLPKLERKEQRCFTDLEIVKLTNKAKPGRERVLIGIFSQNGPRFEEVAGFHQSDIAWGEQATITVNRTVVNGHVKERGKTGNALRTFTLSPELTADLREYVKTLDGEILFPNSRGGYMWYSNFRAWLWDLATRAGVPAPQSKAFRHHHATKLDQLNAPDAVRMARMGHGSANFTRRTYTHRVLSDDARIAREVAESYTGLIQ